METPSSIPFLDRADAGKLLAEHLEPFRGRGDAVVIGLLRGGIAVGREIADVLRLPLLPWNVRKIGHPDNPEYALGAIAQGGGTFLDETSMQDQGIAFAEIEPSIEEELKEMRRRQAVFRMEEEPHLEGKWVILTDDGAATGATLFAAIEDMRKLKVSRVTVALPVCAPDTAVLLREEADDVLCLATPAPFYAVGQWYLSFPQLTDDDVRALLRERETQKR